MSPSATTSFHDRLPTLALDASGPVVSAAAWGGAAVVMEAASAGQQGSRVLHELAREAMRGAGIRQADLKSVAAARGPGSFTGLRVALASASGLAMGLGVPSFGAATTAAGALAAAASVGADGRAVIAVVLDGGHGRAYVAVHVVEGDCVTDVGPVRDATALEAVAIARESGATLAVVGEPAGLEELLAAGARRVMEPLAGAVARLVGSGSASPGLEPLYVRAPAVRPRT